MQPKPDLVTLNNEIDRQLNLFFWHPKNGRDSYRNTCGEDFEKTGYSRLFILRESMYFCLWKNPETGILKTELDHGFDGVPHFAAILIMRSATEMLVRALFAKNFDKPSQKEYKLFYEGYLGIGRSISQPLYFLRNSLAHDGFSLSTYDDGGTKYSFDLCEPGILTGPIEEVTMPKNKDETKQKKYRVDPWLLHDRFESGMEKLRVRLLDSNELTLRGRYKEYLSDRDGWIHVR